MGGEKPKKSGEIGEAIAKDLITRLGWKLTLGNVSIKCSNPSHVNKKGKPKESHGEDRVYIYHNPFHDESSEKDIFADSRRLRRRKTLRILCV